MLRSTFALLIKKNYNMTVSSSFSTFLDNIKVDNYEKLVIVITKLLRS